MKITFHIIHEGKRVQKFNTANALDWCLTNIVYPDGSKIEICENNKLVGTVTIERYLELKKTEIKNEQSEVL